MSLSARANDSGFQRQPLKELSDRTILPLIWGARPPLRMRRPDRPPAASRCYTALLLAGANPSNSVQISCLRGLRMVQIPAVLQVHAEIRRRPKIPGQTQRRPRRDATPAVDQLIDALVGNVDSIGHIALRESLGFRNSSSSISPGCVGGR